MNANGLAWTGLEAWITKQGAKEGPLVGMTWYLARGTRYALYRCLCPEDWPDSAGTCYRLQDDGFSVYLTYPTGRMEDISGKEGFDDPYCDTLLFVCHDATAACCGWMQYSHSLQLLPA
jgi:hypothetical protein